MSFIFFVEYIHGIHVYNYILYTYRLHLSLQCMCSGSLLEHFSQPFVPLTPSRLVVVEMDSRNAASMASIVTFGVLKCWRLFGSPKPIQNTSNVFFLNGFDVLDPSQIIPTFP